MENVGSDNFANHHTGQDVTDEELLRIKREHFEWELGMAHKHSSTLLNHIWCLSDLEKVREIVVTCDRCGNFRRELSGRVGPCPLCVKNQMLADPLSYQKGEKRKSRVSWEGRDPLFAEKYNIALSEAQKILKTQARAELGMDIAPAANADGANGFLYVLTNTAHGGFVKVGRTNDLERRLREHNNVSASVGIWEIAYSVVVFDAIADERDFLDALESYRVEGKRELFACEKETAYAAILRAALRSLERVEPNHDPG